MSGLEWFGLEASSRLSRGTTGTSLDSNYNMLRNQKGIGHSKIHKYKRLCYECFLITCSALHASPTGVQARVGTQAVLLLWPTVLTYFRCMLACLCHTPAWRVIGDDPTIPCEATDSSAIADAAPEMPVLTFNVWNLTSGQPDLV
jgi:hypothetical protein